MRINNVYEVITMSVVDQENEERNIHLEDNFHGLCKDIRFEGLDRYAAQTWIYPTNLSFRQYQFDIVQTALFHNTFVSLPTGLGKTLIAAVVMYNIYRWYPLCRIVFMAPTRPLVTQQALACQKITGIPFEHTAQLTGEIKNKSRVDIWNKARILFLTPQTLHRDLETGICPAHLIRCLVIDEAHKARGKHAYCEVMRSLGNNVTRIRVLALSATPGATASKVAEIARILQIARLEIRTDNSEDVTPYIFNKSIETVVVRLGEPLSTIRDEYILILDFYTRRLMKNGLLKGSAKNFHKGRIFVVQKEYIANCQRKGIRPDHTISQDLSFCLTLYHAYDLLIKHGLRGFSSFFEEHEEKSWLIKNEKLAMLLERIRKYLNKKPLMVDSLPDGTIPEIPKDVTFGHPKYLKLRDIVETHLKNAPDSKVMVFCEYKETVLEAFGALLSCRPTVQPCMFLGQKSLPQKQQLMVVKQFQSGKINTLVCTSVAEEGMDFSSVDLIVCFDIANRSPIRLMQRMGRTGRHQVGKIIMLVTEGREQQTLSESMQQGSVLDSRLLQSPEIISSLLPSGPLILPLDLIPQCIHMYITIPDNVPETNFHAKKQNKKKYDPIKQSSNSKVTSENMFLGEQLPRINFNSKNLWNKSKDTFLNGRISVSSATSDDTIDHFDCYSSFQYNVVQPVIIGNSDDTLLLQSLFKKADELKFKLPSRKLLKITKTKNQDIRNLFGKSAQSQNDQADFAPMNTPQLIKNSKKKKSDVLLKKLALLKNLQYELNIRKFIEPAHIPSKTNISCKYFFDRDIFLRHRKDTNMIKIQSEPDEQVLKKLTNENLKNLNVSDLITSNHKVFNFETFDWSETSIDRDSFKLQTSFTVDENNSNPCLMSEDAYFDEYSFDNNLMDINELEPSDIDHQLVKSNNEFSFEDITETINHNQELQTATKLSLNANELFISPSANFKDKLSVFKSTKQDEECLSNEFNIYSSNSPVKRKRSNEFNSLLENNVKKSRPFCSDLKPHIEYIPSEQSQKTLNFFGLSCIEDLFTEDNNDIFKYNLLIQKSNIKNLQIPLAQMKHQQVLDNEVIDLTANENTTSLPNVNRVSPIIFNSFEQNTRNLKNNKNTCSKLAIEKVNSSKCSQISKIKPTCSNINKDNFNLWDDSLFEFSSLNEEKNNIFPDIKENFISKINDSQKVNKNESKSDMKTAILQKSDMVSLKFNTSMDKTLENELYNESDFLSITDIVNSIDKSNLSTNTKSKSPILSSQKKRKNRIWNTLKCKNKSWSCENSKQVSEETHQLPIIYSQENKQNSSLMPASEAYANKGFSFEKYKFSSKKFSLYAEQNNEQNNDRMKSNLQIENTALNKSKTQIEEEKAYANKGYDFTSYGSDEDIFTDDESLQLNDILSPKLTLSSKQPTLNTSISSTCKQQKKRRCEFINDEAEVTDDESDSTEEDDEVVNNSFIVPDSDLELNSKMHAHYLKSIRSPSKRLKHNAFKIPQLPTMKISDICSQPNWKPDNSYEIDSFCVDSITTEIENDSELSILEIAERKIEREHKVKKNKKRRRILTKLQHFSSSSDDEEIKVLREECLMNKTIIK